MDRYSIHLNRPSKAPKAPSEEVQEMIRKWDANEPIQTIIMGGGSSVNDYELSIQYHMIEICRIALKKSAMALKERSVIETPVSYLEKINIKELGIEIHNEIGEMPGEDFSFGQFHQAIKLAQCFLALGPKETMSIFRESNLREYANRSVTITRKPVAKPEEVSKFLLNVIYNRDEDKTPVPEEGESIQPQMAANAGRIMRDSENLARLATPARTGHGSVTGHLGPYAPPGVYMNIISTPEQAVNSPYIAQERSEYLTPMDAPETRDAPEVDTPREERTEQERPQPQTQMQPPRTGTVLPRAHGAIPAGVYMNQTSAIRPLMNFDATPETEMPREERPQQS